MSQKPCEVPGELTYREHVAQDRSGASGFDGVACSCVGDCNERVFAVADIVSVCDAKDQASGWYVVVVNPYAPSKLSIPGSQQGYLLNLRVGKASDHWATRSRPGGPQSRTVSNASQNHRDYFPYP